MRSALLFSALLLVAAGPAVAQTGQGSLSADDATAIRTLLHEWCAGALEGDLDRTMATFSSHAVEIFENGTSTISRANIAARYRGWFQGGTFTACNNDVHALQGEGNVAVARALNTQTWINERTGSETDYAFTFWMMMKREADGEWRILAHHWADVD